MTTKDTTSRLLEGVALHEGGHLDEAAAIYAEVLAREPENADAHQYLGLVALRRGALAEAIAHIERAVALDPTAAAYHYNLGLARQRRGEWDAAAASYRRAIELAPGLAEAHNNLGNVLREMGDLAAAVESCRKAVALRPSYAEAHVNLGNALQDLVRMGDAEVCFRRALRLDPNLADAHCGIGIVRQYQGRLDEARAAYERAVTVQPDSAIAWNNLGIALQMFADYAGARAAFLRAVDLNPDLTTGHRNLMGVMLYDATVGEPERYAVAQEFGRRYGAKAPPSVRFANPRTAGRRLRVGYVTSDFYDHPVGRNMEPLLAARDRQNFEVIAYTTPGAPDERRKVLQSFVDQWQEIGRQSDAELAEQIRRDGIDILVLLAGRYDFNRPLVASYRAAPVQVSFHDPGTSGVPGMDYLIADPVLVPRRPEEKFAERVVRLGRFYVHPPIPQSPAVSPLPRDARGRITFGSFNSPAKIGAEVLRLWGEVLQAVPGAVLRVKFKNWFANAGLRARFLAGLGVPPERVEFVTDEKGLQGHLAEYHAVDIALDPYPFTGSTTTFEALWMGVPVVTLLGRNMAGRWSASMLRGVRLEEMIARDAGEYVAIARALANDRNRLAALRAGLRERLVASSLCNGRTRARQVERLYRALWRRYCAQTAP